MGPALDVAYWDEHSLDKEKTLRPNRPVVLHYAFELILKAW
jgi:hypothetical protein